MAWLFVVVAGGLETVFAVALKQSDGFSRLVPTLVFLVASAGSFALLSLALRDLPVGTAYAVWTGLGALGTATVGIVALGEPATALRLVSIVLVAAGVVGLAVSQGATT